MSVGRLSSRPLANEPATGEVPSVLVSDTQPLQPAPRAAGATTATSDASAAAADGYAAQQSCPSPAAPAVPTAPAPSPSAPAAAGATTPPRAASAETVAKIDGVGISGEKLAAAIAKGNDFVFAFIADRTTRINLDVFWGPNLDETYYYRLGNCGSDGYGFEPEELARISKSLLSQGFPALNEEENNLVNVTSYFARREAAPRKGICVKHFPGGTPELEATERVGVHFGDTQAIGRWLGQFSRVLSGETPPELVMLSHASYAAAGFPGLVLPADGRIASDFVKLQFDQLPASLNPAVVRYLRDNLGYGGLIIGDWFTDMKSIDAFVKQATWRFTLRADADTRFTVLTSILAIEAGLDFIPIRSGPDDWDAFRRQQPALFAKLESELDASVRATYERVRATRDLPPLRLERMDFHEKLSLKILNPIPCADDDAEKIRTIFRSLWETKGGDIWNRTGVMTLMQREKAIEALTGKSFAPVPKSVADEEPWFKKLMADKTFRKYYDGIPWSSPAIQALFAEAASSKYFASSPALASN
jgi:hypothetical protein